MSEMVERVARAICLDVGEGHNWTQFETEARAAIEAMRVTLPFACACLGPQRDRGQTDCNCNEARAWNRRIDAALNPGPEQPEA